MNTNVAPLPTGHGVTLIAEQRARRDGDPRQPRDGEAQSEPRDNAPDGGPAAPRQIAPLAAEAAEMPAEMLFAAALMASDMPLPRGPSPALRRTATPAWTPPDSPLRLKDKLI